MSASKALSIIYGPEKPVLWRKTIAELIREQALKHGSEPAVIVPWQSFRSTYAELADRSRCVANALLNNGLKHGDFVGIMAGNRHEYIDIFIGAARIGCPVVLLNNTYSPSELLNACRRTCCRIVFMANIIGQVSLKGHLETLCETDGVGNDEAAGETKVVCLDKPYESHQARPQVLSFGHFLKAPPVTAARQSVEEAESMVRADDVINLQFTSGTTGAPKAAMLTNLNLINNARFVGNGLAIDRGDVLCCPPPLFHCFGLVLGVLAAFTHGIPVLLPADAFSPEKTLEAILAEKATILHGVPTMFLAELQAISRTGQKPTSLRTCFAAGSAVTKALVQALNEKMGVKDVLIGYGMTETSPISFMTLPGDGMDKKLSSIGRLVPHAGAKVIDAQGNIVPRGQKGELCTTGFGLQKGYLNNPAKTAEVMRRDSAGVLWMHTGDEVFIDEEGYAHITGRIKDIIIRGGENIYPGEIEERLLDHPGIIEACVTGVEDARYGEAVGAFLRLGAETSRPRDQEIRDWVLQKLARQKAPRHVFWVGGGAGHHISEYPKTGSGKYQKALLREVGNRLTHKQSPRAKL